jgi:carbon monoxide dehydrogenase subunit G
MKLSKRQDIDAPIAFVFAELSDFESWENAALRRGADVRRTDQLAHVGPGMAWDLAFSYRGKPRRLSVRLVKLKSPGEIRFQGVGTSIDGTLSVDLLEMAPARTRVTVQMELSPRTIVARLFLQSLKLAKSKVDDRFKSRVSMVLDEIEARQRPQGRV